MTDQTRNQNWPLPKFYFVVDFGEAKNIPFQEVSGLDLENELIEQRQEDNLVLSNIRMPGLTQSNSITMKKGLFPHDSVFWAWYNSIKATTIKPETILINLMDTDGKPIMSWTLNNAYPVKISTADSREEETEIAIEHMEIAYERLTITNR